MRDRDKLEELLLKYLEDTSSIGESKELNRLLEESGDEYLGTEVLKQLFDYQLADNYSFGSTDIRIRYKVLSNIGEEGMYVGMVTKTIHRVHFLKTAWFRYAVILLLIASATTFLYQKYQEPQKQTAVKQPLEQPDIQPGGNKAILTLADGSTIVLDIAATGNLADQGTTRIVKLDAGLLAYQAGAGTLNGAAVYNTISTPKGGQYQIVLPDGSKVWLNAASSIRFPTVFTKNRKVTITGEAYLEIAADARKPFIVMAGETEVEVLGTSFNMNAYSDEDAIKTTLIEGRIKIAVGETIKQRTQTVFLKPGQQAIVYSDQQFSFPKGNESLQVIKNADIEQVMAWKNGTLLFKAASVQEVMKHLCRWYNIEVSYEGTKPIKRFSGEIPRNVSLQSALKVMEFTGINFRVEGRKVIVRG